MKTETTTEKQTIEQAVEKVVNWWAKKSFETNFNQNNGDDSPNGGLAFILMNMVGSRAQNGVTPEKIAKFKERLTDTLLNGDHRRNSLHVDYHGDKPLTDACQYAGLSTDCLPCKSSTWIRMHGDADNQVTASFGYHGKIEIL